MKHSKLFLILFCSVFVLFSGCKNCDCVQEPREETPSTENQPTNPKTFSLVGKTYISELTWEGSPADDDYWVYIYHFDSKYEVTRTQTPNRDLTPHEDFLYLVEHFDYTLDYPNLSVGQSTNGAIFIDTLTFYAKGLALTFTLL